jgi:hypothetical protein
LSLVKTAVFYPEFRGQVLTSANTEIRGEPMSFSEDVIGGKSENIEQQNIKWRF